jgi:hypothetical protein
LIDYRPATGALTWRNENPATGRLGALDELRRLSLSTAIPTPSSGAWHEAIYAFDKLGFAVTYDASTLKPEIDKGGPKLPHFADVYFVSKVGPQRADVFPTNPDIVEITIRRLVPPGEPIATELKQWLSASPFGSASGVRWHLATLNGMAGVTYKATLRGDRFLGYQLNKNGYEISIRAIATSKAAPTVWPALQALVRSFSPEA